MTTIAARVWKHQQFGFVPHTPVSGDTWTLQVRGVTTSAGASDGTTILDANTDSGGTKPFMGRCWVRILSGVNEGLWKRVVVDTGLGLLTLEGDGFPHQVVGSVSYEVWTSPEPTVVIDSSSGETNAVDAIRAEADDYWVGFYLVPITGTHRGKLARITASTSGGVFTLASAFGSALAADDVCLLRRFFEVSDVSDGLEQPFAETPSYRLDGAIGDGRIVAKAGTFGYSTEVYGSGTVAADGDPAPRSPLAHMMQAAGFDEVLNSTGTTDSGSTTSALDCAAGDWEDLGIGTMVEVINDCAWIQSTVDGATDTINIEPDLPLAPDTGMAVHATSLYRRNRLSRDGDYLGICIEHERDGIRTTMTGCKGNVVLNDGPTLMLAWSMQVDHWIRETERAPYYAGDAYPTQAPIRGTDRKAYIGTTAIDLGGLTASLNNEVAPKAVQGACGLNGRASFGHVNAAPGATFREIISTSDEQSRYQDFLKRTGLALYVIYGSSPGNYLGLRIANARLIQDAKPEDAGGIVDHPSVLAAHDASTTTDGGSTLHIVDDFSMSFA